MSARILSLIAFSATLAGCANEPPAAPVAPVKVEVTDHDFCQIMRRVAGASGKLTWSIDDTPKTIHGVRRLAEAYDKRCASKPINTNPPTS